MTEKPSKPEATIVVRGRLVSSRTPNSLGGRRVAGRVRSDQDASSSDEGVGQLGRRRDICRMAPSGQESDQKV